MEDGGGGVPEDERERGEIRPVAGRVVDEREAVRTGEGLDQDDERDEAVVRALHHPEQAERAGRPQPGEQQPELQALAPDGDRRMGANPQANGGLLKKELKLPDFRSFAVEVPQPGGVAGEATRELGKFLRDVVSREELARRAARTRPGS